MSEQKRQELIAKITTRTRQWGELNGVKLYPNITPRLEKVMNLLPKFGCNAEHVRSLVNILFDLEIPEDERVVNTVPFIALARLYGAANNHIPVLFRDHGETDLILGKGMTQSSSDVSMRYARNQVRQCSDKEITELAEQYLTTGLPW